MDYQRISIGTEGAVLETYFLDKSSALKNSASRPLVVICPGGGYEYCSDREAEPMAMAFCSRGFHACVLRYPCAPARFPTQLITLAQTMAWLRAHAEEKHVDSNAITVCGFSAGGHLAASLGVFWNSEFLQEQTGLLPEQVKPNRMVLGYPVITAGEFISEETFHNLLGDDFDNAALREQVSLEKAVTKDTPPTFLWTTSCDTVVPVESSLLFAAALRRADVPFEAHFYSVGPHGLSLANEVTENAAGVGVEPACEGWIDLAAAWLRR